MCTISCNIHVLDIHVHMYVHYCMLFDHFLVVIGAVSAVDETTRISRVLLFTQQPLLLGTAEGRRGRGRKRGGGGGGERGEEGEREKEGRGGEGGREKEGRGRKRGARGRVGK